MFDVQFSSPGLGGLIILNSQETHHNPIRPTDVDVGTLKMLLISEICIRYVKKSSIIEKSKIYLLIFVYRVNRV